MQDAPIIIWSMYITPLIGAYIRHALPRWREERIFRKELSH